MTSRRIQNYKRLYPSSPGQLFFDAGLNNKYEKGLIEDDESSDCLNVVFENGSVATRGGTSKFNTQAAGTFVFDGLYTRQDRTGSETMVAFGNGCAFYVSGTTLVTIPSAQSVFTAGIRVGVSQAENYLFAGNGGVIPYKYNGTDWTRHGTYSPPTAPTAVSFNSGVVSGVYHWKQTNVNTALVESDVSSASTALTLAAATARVTLSQAPQSFGVSSRKLYRTADGGTTYKLVTTISDNTTSTYDDNISDTALGATAPTDQGVPSNYKVIAFHPGVQRLFINSPTNENYILYSEAGNPYVFKALNFDTFGELSTDIVQGFIPIENGLLVMCRKRTYLWYFPSNDPTAWVKALNKSSYGSQSPFGLINYADGVLAPAMQNDKLVGFAHFVGNTVKPNATLLTVASMGSEMQSDKIEPLIFNINNSYVSGISAISFKNKIYIAIPYGTAQTTNNQVLVYDYSYQRIKKGQVASWCPWDGMTPAQFTIYGGSLYYATSAATGFIYKMNTNTYSDDGVAINSYFTTKDFYGFTHESVNYKDFRYLSALVDLAGSYNMDVTVTIDTDIGVGTKFRIDLTPNSTIWGAFTWGLAQWGGGNYQQIVKVDLGSLSGSRIQFKFSNQNTINQRFKVHYANFLYNIKGSWR